MHNVGIFPLIETLNMRHMGHLNHRSTTQGPPAYSHIYIKGKSVPFQARGARKLKFPDYVTMAQDGGKVVSLTHQPLFTPRKYSWYSILLEQPHVYTITIKK